MGNSCAKTYESGDIEHIQSSVANTTEKNNNNNDTKTNEPNNTKDGKCALYVRKVLDDTVVTEEEVAELSWYLCDVPGDELLFNFDKATDNSSETGAEEVEIYPEISPVEPDTYFSKEPDLKSESMEELDMAERKTKWARKRNNDIAYKIPHDKFSVIYEEHLDLSTPTPNRLIYTVSDLHLGGKWSDGMEDKLRTYLNKLIEKVDQIACLVLLGDIFEMWLDKFHQVPPTNAEQVKRWKDSYPFLVASVKTLVEKGVRVYYIRGNHDHEIEEQDVKELFDGMVQFVPCTMILRVKVSGDQEYRIRFAHGHQWDVFNSYILHQTKNLLPDKPIGYYVARAVATSGGKDSGREIEEILIGIAKSILTAVPNDLEDDLVDVLSLEENQKKLLVRLFEGAFKVKDINVLINAKCRVQEKKYVKLQTMLEYPLFRLCSNLVGQQNVFHMIKAATGDYSRFIKRSDEDVILLAHTHLWDLKRFRNHRGNTVIYANTGCWTKACHQFSAVVINPPGEASDGHVLIDYGKN